MTEPPRILMILHEGLADTVIDSQVLLHARTMREAGIARLEIWSFAWNRDLLKRSRERRDAAEKRAAEPVRVLRSLRPGLPFSRYVNGFLLGLALARYRPAHDIIHARTDYTAACCAVLARLGRLRPFVWDCRGDALAELDLSLRDRPWPLRIFRRRAAAADLRLAAQNCAGAIFVSRPLAELAAPELRTRKFAIIPCGASSQHFFFEPELRRRIRSKLGVAADQEIYIYSGGLAPYQCFGQTLKLFAARYRRNPRCRLLVLTTATEAAQREIAAHRLPGGAVMLRRALLEEVNAFLNAADCAFMLREENPINFSAAPTKFAEYCMVGLPIIMTGAVRDSAALARRYGNMVEAVSDGGWDLPVLDRATLGRSYTGILSRTAQQSVYQDLYRAVWSKPQR